MGNSSSTSPGAPSMMDKVKSVTNTAISGVKDTVSTATQKVKDTMGVAGVPEQLTSTPSASNTLGTGAGDTMLGGRRRRQGKKSLRGGRRRKSKKTIKHQ
jgi:hypothetical protein